MHANNKTTAQLWNHPHYNLIIKHQLTVNFGKVSWTLQLRLCDWLMMLMPLLFTIIECSWSIGNNEIINKTHENYDWNEQLNGVAWTVCWKNLICGRCVCVCVSWLHTFLKAIQTELIFICRSNIQRVAIKTRHTRAASNTPHHTIIWPTLIPPSIISSAFKGFFELNQFNFMVSTQTYANAAHAQNEKKRKRKSRRKKPLP